MQMLGNIIMGAILAAVSLAPNAWTDVHALLDSRLLQAVVRVATQRAAGSPLDQMVTSTRAALGQAPSNAGLRT